MNPSFMNLALHNKAFITVIFMTIICLFGSSPHFAQGSPADYTAPVPLCQDNLDVDAIPFSKMQQEISSMDKERLLQLDAIIVYLFSGRDFQKSLRQIIARSYEVQKRIHPSGLTVYGEIVQKFFYDDDSNS